MEEEQVEAATPPNPDETTLEDPDPEPEPDSEWKRLKEFAGTAQSVLLDQKQRCEEGFYDIFNGRRITEWENYSNGQMDLLDDPIEDSDSLNPMLQKGLEHPTLYEFFGYYRRQSNVDPEADTDYLNGQNEDEEVDLKETESLTNMAQPDEDYQTEETVPAPQQRRTFRRRVPHEEGEVKEVCVYKQDAWLLTCMGNGFYWKKTPLPPSMYNMKVAQEMSKEVADLAAALSSVNNRNNKDAA